MNTLVIQQNQTTSSWDARAQSRWSWLKDLGAESAAANLARRIRFVNVAAVFGVLVTFLWALAALSLHFGHCCGLMCWPLLAMP